MKRERGQLGDVQWRERTGKRGGSGFVVESRRRRREGGLARIERKGEDRDRTGEREK